MTEIGGIAMAIDHSAMSGPSTASLRRPRREDVPRQVCVNPP